ncbi:MAG: type II secretion system F family protein [Akkermansiaceae bacterium]|nr:type II secretion system F family protein [Armatimonadota bacterium]
MAMFRYEATDAKTGQTQQGTVEAANAQEIELRLSERGYRSVRVYVEKANAVIAGSPPTPNAGGAGGGAARPTVGRNSPPSLPAPPALGVGGLPAITAFAPAVPPADLATFFRQMASLLHAGFTPLSALADLAPRTANRRLSRAAQDAGMAAGRGESLAGAFAKHPHVFPAHVVGLFGAGETGGFLEYACEEAALGAEGDAALRQGIWVPKLLFWQSVWSFLILQPLLNNLKPIFTEGLAGFTKVGQEFLFLWVPIGIALHLLCELAGWWWRQPFAAQTRDKIALMLPAMRKLAYTRAVAAFTRLLRRLLLSGVSPESAYTAAAQSVPNSVYRDKLLSGVTVLRAGNGLDAALQATGLLEHDPLQLLITGQRTGQWTEMLDRVTAYYQEQAAKATEDAKNAQKRLAFLVTAISAGYVTIAATVGPLKAVMELFGE